MAVDRKRLTVLFSEENKTLEEIGQEFGVSRERIRQIVAEMGLTRDSRVCIACLQTFTPTAGGQDRCAECVARDRTEGYAERAETNVASGWKICPRCERKLSRAAFSADTGGQDHAYCKACMTKQSKKAATKAVSAGTVGKTVLSDGDKRRICEYLAAQTYSQAELARMFGVSQTTISLVWKSHTSRA